MSQINEIELQASCRLLYGRNVVINRQFLENLQHSELKKIFRQKAFATHPDRFSHYSVHRQKYFSKLFIELKEAYEKICDYLMLREKDLVDWNNQYAGTKPKRQPKPNYQSNNQTKNKKTGPKPNRNNFSSYTEKSNYSKSWNKSNSYNLYLPKRPLLFGEFLYFSGIITMKCLIKAIISQRKERERIGEIARRWGWVTQEKISDMLNERCYGERLGEIMLRHKILTPFKLSMLLRFQQICQSPIGEYFTKRNIITERELNNLLEDVRLHNYKYAFNSKTNLWEARRF